MLLFVALQLTECKAKGVLGRAASLFVRSQPRAEEREALGAHYRLILAPSRGGAPDWPAIARLADTRALLLPDRVPPPPKGIVKPLQCPRFERQVLASTACEVVHRTRMPMYRRIVGLLDPLGKYAGLLFPLLHHYTAARVYTLSPERYERAAADIGERLGAPVASGPDLSLLDGSVLILAPGPVPDLPERPFPAPILAGRGFTPPAGSEVFSGLRASVPPELVEHSPDGISPNRFAAALYDHCGLDVGGYVSHQMQRGASPSDLPTCIHSVMRRIGRLY